MPIYEYRCQACGHEMDALQKMSEPELTDCPACEEASLKRLISAVGFRLKGGGWYETDFKTGDKKKNLVGDSDKGGADSKKESSDKKSGDAKSSEKTTAKANDKTTKSESKPAAKTAVSSKAG